MSQLVSAYGDVISRESRKKISERYHKITQAVNISFWHTNNDNIHSLYVGSYGRNTAISTSDIDILVSLPRDKFNAFNDNFGNGQSQLLQAVKNALKISYPRTDIRADGQVIKVNFYDGMKFEVLPAFRKANTYFNDSIEGYDYPDSNLGGNWRATNPKAEQAAIQEKNEATKKLYRDTCRHMRYIRDSYYSSYHLSGIVIDSFVYSAMGEWKYSDPGTPTTTQPGDYERSLLAYFKQHNFYGNMSLVSPGSGQNVDTQTSIECLEKVLTRIVG
ncbi:SMODS domain-containing nucleotidyltransferase [Lactiplantibacillus plantarum]|uniref:SMODS domain-containing nucleotidyltransferase n=1 Tax=Lactiplantibacillus plantarum TaxID=1590 RepID=UPI002001A679|nr:nucleotidyltransferase domain-containing protein [Lactiplantibacillus plantarum]